MTELVGPDLRFHASWAAAVREFEAVGDVTHGSGLWNFVTSDLSETALEPEVDRLLAEADPATPLPNNWVHSSNFWTADEDEFVGYLAIRHRVTEFLHEVGAHIGYSVLPNSRREGHATRALALALGEARALGIDRALVTWDHDNRASRLTIERAGGVLEDRRGDKLRYWFDLTA